MTRQSPSRRDRGHGEAIRLTEASCEYRAVRQPYPQTFIDEPGLGLAEQIADHQPCYLVQALDPPEAEACTAQGLQHEGFVGTGRQLRRLGVAVDGA